MSNHFAVIETRTYTTGIKRGLTLTTSVRYPDFTSASAALARIPRESGVEVADAFGTADGYRVDSAYISAEVSK